MTPEAKQLLKDKPELCKEIATAYAGEQYFWDDWVKEHTTPDWEILSFRDSNGTPITKYPNGFYGRASGSASLELHLRKKRLIHSVRRSDGEVFEVGNRTNNGTIERFETSGDSMRVFFKTKGNYHVNIDTLTSIKPLFKTEDGVDIYEEEEYCYFFGEMLHDAKAHITAPYQSDVKRFSTREAAEAWVEDHKPRYSIADLKARGLHI